jgi:ankyrin repeat protein
MRIPVQAAGWLAAVVLVSTAATAAAADPDLRLVQAAADQDRQAVRALIAKGVDVNAARADGVTALLWAAHWNDLEMVNMLLQARVNVNAADDHGVTPLARAAENASPALVSRLLEAGANPNLAQESGLTPLMIAARTGNVQVARALLARGADVNATTGEASASALMWAIANGHRDFVRLLIEAKADVHHSTTKGFTPLMFAARNGDIEMAKALIAAGVSVNETGRDGTHVLPYALTQAQDKFALFLIEQGADPNGTIGGIPALHAAAGAVGTWLNDWSRRHGVGGSLGLGGGGSNMSYDRRYPIVKALLEKGANPNGRITASAMFMGYIGYPKKGAFEPFATGTGDLAGATPLWVAAYTANAGNRGQGGGGQGQGQNQGQGGAEMAAATGGHTSSDVIKLLLAAGADQHLTTADGTTPLMVAAGMGRATFQPGLQRGQRSVTAEEAVTILLEAGANIHAVNEADFTALHGAAFRGLNEVIKILVDRGADINARDYKGRTAYRIAEGAKQSFQFQAYPATAEFIKGLGANTRLGVPGTVQERARDLAALAAADAATGGQQQ